MLDKKSEPGLVMFIASVGIPKRCKGVSAKPFGLPITASSSISVLLDPTDSQIKITGNKI